MTMTRNTLDRTNLLLRNLEPDDISLIPALMRRVYPPPHGPEAIWRELALWGHLGCFPEGQHVVTSPEGRLVATSTLMRIALESALAPHTWFGITGGGSLAHHNPQGDALYGVNIAVDPEFQGLGIATRLYDERMILGRILGCKAFVAGARIPGYHKYAARISPETYVTRVVLGEVYDPTLSKQLALGFKVRGVLRDYGRDPDTLDHAALIVKEL